MDSRLKVASFILTILVMATALSSVFEQVPVFPLDNLFEEEEDQTPYEDRQLLLVDITSLAHKLIFSVFEGYGVSYLRSSVLTQYDSGAWTSTPSVEVRYYTNQDLDTEYSPYAMVMEDSLSISPASNFTSYIPLPKNTRQLDIGWSAKMLYSEEYSTFRTEEPLDELYSVKFDRCKIPEDALNETDIGEVDDIYLQLPERLEDRIRNLAEFVSSASESPYQKAKDIERFLKTTFAYKASYERAPPGEDPVEWFLFESGEGICTHFNSAFVLMARSLGIPARLCVGYLLDPDSFVQHVYLDQAHVFAEIKLEGMGWLTFDATGLAEETQFTPPDPNPPLGTVSGIVFYDKDANRIIGPEEPGIEGQTVVVQNRTSGDVMSVITDQAGRYFLSGLEEGEYSISVLPDDDMIIPNFQLQRFYHTRDMWWTFDIGLAYPSDFPDINETMTSITQNDPILYRNGTFLVHGIVNCTSDRRLSGPMIFAYLVREKGANQRWICGMDRPQVYTGEFSIQCKLPSDIPTGDYSLVARCAGDRLWNSSDSDPEVKVIDRSTFLYNGSMHLVSDIPCRLSFTLVESSTLEPVIGQAVTLRCEGEEVEFTDDHGEVSIDLVPSVGNHSVELDFAGTYLLEGNITRFDLEAFQPGVTLVRSDLVRGEENRILGRVLAGDIPLGGAELEMELSLDVEENATSDSNGYFTIYVELQKDVELEEIDCLFTLPGFDILDHVYLRVTARPSIELSVRENMVSARLTDDYGTPIVGETLAFSTTDLEVNLTTDQDGTTWLNMGSVEEVNLTVNYEGSQIYQPVSATMVYAPAPGPNWLLIVAVTLVIAAVVGGTVALRRRRSSGPFESVVPEDEPILVERSRSMPYHFTFKEIPQNMPLVWEAGTPLHLVLSDPDEDVHVRIDGSEVQGMWDRDGMLFTLVMEKGDHIIQLEGVNGIHEEMIRAVVYREEVVDLFNSAILRWGRHFPSLTKDMTTREVHSLVKDRYHDRSEHLETMVSAFELANYSNHPISRKEYERMFLATAELI
ncbi:MAG: hypothetical protein GKC03_09735 [Methanomassiliicoccales archaeon]|nr:hypothetical protein [Methanomassiliicoccales archaeon]NYT14514.1 hypothetical protein [Methanomassiliicoccales archaeon]